MIPQYWFNKTKQHTQGVWVWSQEVLVLGTRAVVLRLCLPHQSPADARGLPHQTSHDGCLCAGASQVLARCGKRGELQRQMTLREVDCQVRCRTKLRESGGTLTLRLLLRVTFCCNAGTSIVFCVTAEETLPVFRDSLVPTKCLTRVELTCPMIIPL